MLGCLGRICDPETERVGGAICDPETERDGGGGYLQPRNREGGAICDPRNRRGRGGATTRCEGTGPGAVGGGSEGTARRAVPRTPLECGVGIACTRKAQQKEKAVTHFIESCQLEATNSVINAARKRRLQHAVGRTRRKYDLVLAAIVPPPPPPSCPHAPIDFSLPHSPPAPTPSPFAPHPSLPGLNALHSHALTTSPPLLRLWPLILLPLPLPPPLLRRLAPSSALSRRLPERGLRAPPSLPRASERISSLDVHPISGDKPRSYLASPRAFADAIGDAPQCPFDSQISSGAAPPLPSGGATKATQDQRDSAMARCRKKHTRRNRQRCHGCNRWRLFFEVDKSSAHKIVTALIRRDKSRNQHGFHHLPSLAPGEAGRSRRGGPRQAPWPGSGAARGRPQISSISNEGRGTAAGAPQRLCPATSCRARVRLILVARNSPSLLSRLPPFLLLPLVISLVFSPLRRPFSYFVFSSLPSCIPSPANSNAKRISRRGTMAVPDDIRTTLMFPDYETKRQFRLPFSGSKRSHQRCSSHLSLLSPVQSAVIHDFYIVAAVSY
ncbi:hypothetical protein C7M84_019423 [Penaeus vannamei]|uniref:Uncharacterized protein n=1 Tax=Penaeus vannamei TaxID=6689 RepID=A0A423SEV0_PENVA|nr:hypothetical protein C7M84_019423 [Penaeus vannamei]